MHGYHRSESGKARAEVGSTRWVYNKFLRTRTKLRWVCGLCNVWCKDENGFKCHLEHENHIRKSELARESAGRQFKVTPKDEAFAQRFVIHIAQNYLNQKVLLHQIYKEMYPKDAKTQLLIKDTCWGTLGVFVNALSKAGELEAYREPKGWVVRIGQDRLIAAELEADARERAGGGSLQAEDLEQPNAEASGAAWEDYTLLKRSAPDDGPSCLLARRGEVAEIQVPRSRADRMQASWAKLREGVVPMRERSPPRPDDGGLERAAALARKAASKRPSEELALPLSQAARGGPRLDARPVRFALVCGPAKQRREGERPPADVGGGAAEAVEASPGAAEAPALGAAAPRPLPPGLVVKVLCPKALGGRARLRKARTLTPEELAEEEAAPDSPPGGVALRLLPPAEGWAESDRRAGLAADFRVAQGSLETVLPKLGGGVRILQEGPLWLREGKLRSLELESFSCTVDVPAEGPTVRGLPYDCVCKIWEEGQLQHSATVVVD